MNSEIASLLRGREILSGRVVHGACNVLHGHKVMAEQRHVSAELSKIAEALPRAGYRDRFTSPAGDARICSGCGDATDVYGQCCTKCRGDSNG